jgi:hypothetical protein
MGSPPRVAWPGGLPCPWNRGTVDTVACKRPPGASDGANEVGPTGSGRRPCGRLRCRVGWWGACGWGSGMPGTVRPDPSILGVVGERASRHEGRLWPIPGNAPGGTSAPSSNLCLSMSGRLPQTGQPTPAWGATAVDEPDRVTRARERAAEAKAHELEAHRRAEELHEEAAVTLERLGRRDLAQAPRRRAQRARELYAEALREQTEALRKQDEADERATGHDGK